jgi:hypothetical protein
MRRTNVLDPHCYMLHCPSHALSRFGKEIAILFCLSAPQQALLYEHRGNSVLGDEMSRNALCLTETMLLHFQDDHPHPMHKQRPLWQANMRQDLSISEGSFH